MKSQVMTVEISELINKYSISKYQLWIFFLCFLVAVLDGFDSMAMGIGAPWISAALNIDYRLLGPVFSASQAGFVVGAMSFGMVADFWGRKRALVLAIAVFSVFSFLTASVQTFEALFLCRVLVGVGVGGAAPCFVALACEYSPQSSRANVISWMWTGIPVGGIAGGLFAANVMPWAGWQSLFLVGGVVPALLAVLIVFSLPESFTWLSGKPKYAHRLGRIVRRLAPATIFPEDARFVAKLAIESLEKVSMRDLFGRENAVRTISLWTACFFVWLTLTAMTAWSPSLLKVSGMTPAQTGIAMTTSMVGAAIGTVFTGKLMEFVGSYRTIIASLFVSAVASAVIATIAGGYEVTIAFVFIFGFAIAVAIAGLVAIAALSCPPRLRSTSVGCAVGVGRVGSFVGPLLIGAVVAARPGAWLAFLAMGATSLIGAVFVSLLSVMMRRTAGDAMDPVDSMSG